MAIAAAAAARAKAGWKKGDKPASERTNPDQYGAAEQVEGLTKVISLSKLRTSYKQFAARRELAARYDLFLCDDRITPMLTQVRAWHHHYPN